MYDKAKQLEILLAFGKAISKENNLDRLLEIMADFAKDLLRSDRCSVFIYDETLNELWTRFAHGVDEIRVSAEHGIAGSAALLQEVQLIEDAYNDDRFNPAIDKQTGYRTDTILATPLLDYHGNTIGVFQAINKLDGVFTNADIEMLNLISNAAADAIEKVLLYDQLRQTQEKVILKLSAAAEFKDNEVPYHTERVGLYSALIAKAMNMNEKEVELISITAPMHDTGKVGIPEALLKKQGKLNDEESAVMKQHTQIGYDLLYDEDNTLLKTAAIIAREHHEKFDGSGYPAGLKGEEISIFARITAIADIFDSLSARPSYQQVWGFNETMKFIDHLSGKHFDPELVNAFLSKRDELYEIYKKYGYV